MVEKITMLQRLVKTVLKNLHGTVSTATHHHLNGTTDKIINGDVAENNLRNATPNVLIIYDPCSKGVLRTLSISSYDDYRIFTDMTRTITRETPRIFTGYCGGYH